MIAIMRNQYFVWTFHNFASVDVISNDNSLPARWNIIDRFFGEPISQFRCNCHSFESCNGMEMQQNEEIKECEIEIDHYNIRNSTI